MHQILTMLQILIGWSIIIWIADYMICDGLVDEIRRLIREAFEKR